MRRILVGLDGSPLAETILPFVEILARKTGATARLLHVVSVPERTPPVDDHPAIDQLVRQATQLADGYLREQQRRLGAAGVETSIAVVAGTPALEIARHAEQQEFDVIALATHGRSGVQRWAHGSVADQVLHTTAIPLLLVRPGDGWGATPRDIHRVVVPLDGSADSEAALQIAEPLATRCGVPLVLLQFVPDIVPDFVGDPLGVAYANVQGLTESAVEAARNDLETTAGALRQRGLTASAQVSVALPAEGIAAYARQHPDSLVVLTTHGRTGWREFLLGSVARRVVQTVAVPIMVCPPRKGGATR